MSVRSPHCSEVDVEYCGFVGRKRGDGCLRVVVSDDLYPEKQKEEIQRKSYRVAVRLLRLQ